MILFALVSVLFGQEKKPPIAIECTFYGNLDYPKKLRLRGYSDTKVAPEDIVFWRPEIFPRNNYPDVQGFWVLGRGVGHITTQADWHELGAKLRKQASDHGANVIAYQISGIELRLQFLRVRDNLLKFAVGQKDMKPSR
jgi:hypothetical protein